MTFTVNKVILAGRIGDYGVKLTYLPSGKPELTFALVLERPVGEKVYKTFIGIQVYGSQAEPLAATLEPGDLVMVQGALSYKADRRPDASKTGKRTGALAVSTFAVEVLQRAPVAERST